MTNVVPVWRLIPVVLLILLYAMLIFVALTDQHGFYEAMDMPLPNHGFMHISWTGKTAAIWAVLLVATLTRRRGVILVALVGVVIQQIGDTIAGALTGVDVFVTYIGLGLSALSVTALLIGRTTPSQA